jgi:hypothetical protein
LTTHEALFESEQHPLSQRWAVVEDDGAAAWLYLSAPKSTKPVAACFLYNQSNAPVDQLEKGVHFHWSPDGNSVAALVGELVMGFIAGAKRPGFSRLLTAPSSLGNPLDSALYERTFRAT